MIRRIAFLLAVCAATSAGCGGSHPAAVRAQLHSSAIAVSPDGAQLYVVHPDADSVSILNVASRGIEHEIALGSGPPAVDPTTQRFDPAVEPRALALDSKGKTLYVTGERSGMLYAVDTGRAQVTGSVAVCSEPAGVLVDAEDAQVYVAGSQDDEIVQVDAASLSVVVAVPVPRKPWALAWSADGATLMTTHLLGPGVSTLSTAPLALASTWALADGADQGDPTIPHGVVRGVYDVVARPGSSEVWAAHLMLGIDTPQPTLVFDSTVFPALSILDPANGSQLARLSVQADGATAGSPGAFGDVVSGPHAIAFSDDGRYAFVVDTNSEDLLVVDATSRTEATLVRPLPGHLPEGVVVHGDEVYVQERNSEDVVAFHVQADGDAGVTVTQDGSAFASLSADPMPANLRLGQKLFYSADSDDVPITQNHWVACASCHVEGRSDAVTWRFAQGPRDTPSNAGGTVGTGFLFRTADRTKVQDYWMTIDVEQGGHFQPGGEQQPLLDAIEAFVDYALPAPVPPSTDESHTVNGDALAALRSQGEAVFQQSGCPTCHGGPLKTDSGGGNADLDLAGPIVSTMTPGGVLLHDVGTCVSSGPWPDVAHDDITGNPRPSCAFDTPALRGLTDSAPYFHDGSAATLEDVLPVMLKASASASGAVPSLGAADQAALVEYLRSL
jgi:YVTN family beta-propeller protein